MNFSRTLILVFLLIALPSARAAAQGDYLNEQEVERVREAQEIDKRTAVFLHIAARRLDAITGAPAAAPTKETGKKDKHEKKDKDKEQSDDYGPAPTGTLVELLDNYSHVMSELLDKLDDNYERKKNDPNLAKAITKLLDASHDHLERLGQLRTKIRSASEETALEKAMEIAKMAMDGARGFKTQ